MNNAKMTLVSDSSKSIMSSYISASALFSRAIISNTKSTVLNTTTTTLNHLVTSCRPSCQSHTLVHNDITGKTTYNKTSYSISPSQVVYRLNPPCSFTCNSVNKKNMNSISLPKVSTRVKRPRSTETPPSSLTTLVIDSLTMSLNTPAASNTPGTASNTPATASNTSAAASNTPATVSNTPATASNTSAAASNTPATPSNTPATASNTPATASNTPAPASNTPVTDSNTPATASNTPATASKTLFTITNAALVISVTASGTPELKTHPDIQINLTDSPDEVRDDTLQDLVSLKKACIKASHKVLSKHSKDKPDTVANVLIDDERCQKMYGTTFNEPQCEGRVERRVNNRARFETPTSGTNNGTYLFKKHSEQIKERTEDFTEVKADEKECWYDECDDELVYNNGADDNQIDETNETMKEVLKAPRTKRLNNEYDDVCNSNISISQDNKDMKNKVVETVRGVPENNEAEFWDNDCDSEQVNYVVAVNRRSDRWKVVQPPKVNIDTEWWGDECVDVVNNNLIDPAKESLTKGLMSTVLDDMIDESNNEERKTKAWTETKHENEKENIVREIARDLDGSKQAALDEESPRIVTTSSKISPEDNPEVKGMVCFFLMMYKEFK